MFPKLMNRCLGRWNPTCTSCTWRISLSNIPSVTVKFSKVYSTVSFKDLFSQHFLHVYTFRITDTKHSEIGVSTAGSSTHYWKVHRWINVQKTVPFQVQGWI